MFRTRFLTAGTIFGAAALLQGCMNSDSTSGPDAELGTDEEGIQNVVLDEDADWADTDVRYFDADAGPAAAPVATHAWRRQLTDFERDLNIVIDAEAGEIPTATVSATGRAIGLLHLWACEEDDLAHYTKDWNDTAQRTMVLKKIRPTARPHRGWRLAETTGVLIQSEGTTRQIQSVRIQAGDVDVTVDNVTDLIAREDVTRIPAGTEATITVDTGDATDAVFVHVRKKGFRSELTSNDDGTFSGTYVTGERPGVRHLLVDVLSNGTLYDDTEAYDNLAWGIPYVLQTADGDDGEDDGSEE